MYITLMTGPLRNKEFCLLSEKQDLLFRAGPVIRCLFIVQHYTSSRALDFVEYTCYTRNEYMYRCSTVKDTWDKSLLYRVVPSSMPGLPADFHGAQNPTTKSACRKNLQ